jgi:RNA polymerase primary sigma factor
VHVAEELNRLDRVSGELGVQLGHEPDVAELAAAASMSVERVGELSRLDRDTISLDTTLGEDDQLRFADVLVQDDVASAMDLVERHRLAEDVRAAVATLPTTEALVISQRFGLGDRQPRTLQEIHVDIGLSRERDRQLQRHALVSLRESDRREQLLSWIR